MLTKLLTETQLRAILMQHINDCSVEELNTLADHALGSCYTDGVEFALECNTDNLSALTRGRLLPN